MEKQQDDPKENKFRGTIPLGRPLVLNLWRDVFTCCATTPEWMGLSIRSDSLEWVPVNLPLILHTHVGCVFGWLLYCCFSLGETKLRCSKGSPQLTKWRKSRSRRDYANITENFILKRKTWGEKGHSKKDNLIIKFKKEILLNNCLKFFHAKTELI